MRNAGWQCVEVAAEGAFDVIRGPGRPGEAAESTAGMFPGRLRCDGKFAKIEAARLYVAMGDEQRAEDLYRQVARHGYGWATGLALYDQAVRAMFRGNHEEAREAATAAGDRMHADQIRVAILATLADSYYQDGRLRTGAASITSRRLRSISRL